MRKLLISSAALALSTSFAFASTYSHTPSFSFTLTTGNNTSRIVNANIATRGGYVDSTNVNVVTQNSGLFVIAPLGILGNAAP